MRIDRRTLLGSLAFSSGAWSASGQAVNRSPGGRRRSIKAIAFDGFPIIDSTPVAKRVEALFPGGGAALLKEWRTRQFEYTWLRTLGGTYADFWEVTQEALEFAATSLALRLTEEARDTLVRTYLELGAWEDVRPALEVFKRAGIRMAFLSNFTARMLDAALARSGLQGFFEAHLTTDRVQAFKPDRRAYEMGVEAFGVPRQEIVFCAAAGWDVAGAKWFGYPTFWVNRSHQPAESLGVSADGVGAGMADLVSFVLGG